jgi:ribosome assembly protein YihI (activator of Der GTPase)
MTLEESAAIEALQDAIRRGHVISFADIAYVDKAGRP